MSENRLVKFTGPKNGLGGKIGEILKWDHKSHDERLAKEDKGEALKKVGVRYERFKALSLKLNTREAQAKALKVLRRDIKQICKRHGMERDPWTRMTIAMIDQKIQVMESGRPLAMNSITFPGDPPRVKTFSSLDELKELSEVACHLSLKDEIVGLVRDGPIVQALYRDGILVVVGGVANAVGVEKLPTVKEMRDELGL